MDLSKLSRGDRFIVIAGTLLVLDLLFLPFYSYNLGIVTVSFNGLSAWNSFLGFLAFIVSIVMVAQIIVSKYTSARIPELSMPWSRVHMIAGYTVLGLLVLKLILHLSNLGYGALVAIILAGVLAFGGYTVNQESTRTGSA